MPFVVALCLALLHALSFAAPPRPSTDAATAPSARVERAIGAAHRLEPSAPESPEQALRAARGVATSAFARAAGRVPPGGGAPPASLVPPAGSGLATTAAHRVLQRYGAAPRALAAQGRLLPYFPTPPPSQGC